jgi:endonuclease/exonuclease/phosphatase family metal-dependent hydrolase
MSRRFRIATYNIHKGVLNDLFGFRRVPVIHELRDRLHDLEADLIFLQEVQGQNQRHANRFERWPDEPQDVFLARSPELRHVFETAYGNNAKYLHGHHGNALLSRFPILHRENRDVSDHALEKRGVLHCVVLIDNQPVHCFVVHFGLLARSRARQVDALIEWVNHEVPAETPLIIGGDFNDWQNRLSGRICRSLNAVEVFDDFRPQYRRMKQVARYVTDQLGMQGVEIDKPIWQTEVSMSWMPTCCVGPSGQNCPITVRWSPRLAIPAGTRKANGRRGANRSQRPGNWYRSPRGEPALA